MNGVPLLKYGTICLIPADNLASNALGGFKEGSTATHGCRHCLATPADMKSYFYESYFSLRTADDHSRKCDELDSASTEDDRKRLSKEFGINHRSILDELQYFNVCSGALVQDVMHDLLEGIVIAGYIYPRKWVYVYVCTCV